MPAARLLPRTMRLSGRSVNYTAASFAHYSDSYKLKTRNRLTMVCIQFTAESGRFVALMTKYVQQELIRRVEEINKSQTIIFQESVVINTQQQVYLVRLLRNHLVNGNCRCKLTCLFSRNKQSLMSNVYELISLLVFLPPFLVRWKREAVVLPDFPLVHTTLYSQRELAFVRRNTLLSDTITEWIDFCFYAEKTCWQHPLISKTENKKSDSTRALSQYSQSLRERIFR